MGITKHEKLMHIKHILNSLKKVMTAAGWISKKNNERKIFPSVHDFSQMNLHLQLMVLYYLKIFGILNEGVQPSQILIMILKKIDNISPSNDHFLHMF